MKREGSSIDLFVVLCEERRVRDGLNDAFHNDREAESGRLSDFITAPKVAAALVYDNTVTGGVDDVVSDAPEINPSDSVVSECVVPVLRFVTREGKHTVSDKKSKTQFYAF